MAGSSVGNVSFYRERASERPAEQQVERPRTVLTEPGGEIDWPERALGPQEHTATGLEAAPVHVILRKPGVASLHRDPEVGRELEESRAAAAHAPVQDPPG